MSKKSKGMLVDDQFLTEQEARAWLEDFFKKDQKKEWEQTKQLQNKIKNLQNKIKTGQNLKTAYKDWEQICNKFFKIPKTDVLVINLDPKGNEIQHYSFGLEANYLNSSSSTQVSVNGQRIMITDQNSVQKAGRAEIERAVLEQFKVKVQDHCNQFLLEMHTEKPSIEEAAYNYYTGQTSADQSIYGLARDDRSKLYCFYQLGYGRSTHEDKQWNNGRIIEMFADHIAKRHSSLLKDPDTGKTPDETVRKENSITFLNKIRYWEEDNDRYTKGGDLIVDLGDGKIINVQLKTLTGKINKGGNSVRLQIITDTLQRWSKILELQNPEKMAEQLFSYQSTEGWVEDTNSDIETFTEEQVQQILNWAVTKYGNK